MDDNNEVIVYRANRDEILLVAKAPVEHLPVLKKFGKGTIFNWRDTPLHPHLHPSLPAGEYRYFATGMSLLHAINKSCFSCNTGLRLLDLGLLIEMQPSPGNEWVYYVVYIVFVCVDSRKWILTRGNKITTNKYH